MTLNFKDVFERYRYFDVNFISPFENDCDDLKVIRECLALFYELIKKCFCTKYPISNIDEHLLHAQLFLGLLFMPSSHMDERFEWKHQRFLTFM